MSFKQHISNLVLTVSMGFVAMLLYLSLALFLLIVIAFLFPLLVVIELLEVYNKLKNILFKWRMNKLERNLLTKDIGDETSGTP